MSSSVKSWSAAALPRLVVRPAFSAKEGDFPDLTEEFNVSRGVEAGNQAAPTFGAAFVYEATAV